MSDKKIIGTPFTPETAPRNGRVPGSRNKIKARAWKVIDTLLADYKEYGDKAVEYFAHREAIRIREGFPCRD